MYLLSTGSQKQDSIIQNKRLKCVSDLLTINEKNKNLVIFWFLSLCILFFDSRHLSNIYLILHYSLFSEKKLHLRCLAGLYECVSDSWLWFIWPWIFSNLYSFKRYMLGSQPQITYNVLQGFPRKLITIIVIIFWDLLRPFPTIETKRAY